MANLSKEVEKRIDTRLELSLPITLFAEPKIESISKNICANGVYFEVDGDYVDSFPLGRAITFEIVANISSFRLPNKTVMLSGNGVIIRCTRIDNHDKKTKTFYVALKFMESLKVISVSL